MKLSQIQKSDVVDFLRLEEGTYSDTMLEAVMKAAKDYILKYTGLTEAEADEEETFYIAFMVLCQDMFDNRSMYVPYSEKSSTNKVVESILAMHSTNLL